MADVGRKSKYETHVKPYLKKIEEWLNNGASEEQCALALGLCYSTFNNYKRKYPELKAVCEKPRIGVVVDLRSTLVKKALGFTYEEKEQYIKQEVDPVTKQPIGKPTMHTRIVTKQALPDTTAIFGALNMYDEEYCKDRKQYELKRQELELRQLSAEKEDW